MKEPINEVSKKILDLVAEKGDVTLFELEQSLDVSYNLIFLAIDSMVTNNQIHLQRCGRDYFLSGVENRNKLRMNDTCINEYLCQDV